MRTPTLQRLELTISPAGNPDLAWVELKAATGTTILIQGILVPVIDLGAIVKSALDAYVTKP